MLGWSVTVALAIPTALASVNALAAALGSSVSTSGKPLPGTATFLNHSLWPGVTAEIFLLSAAACCLRVLWPSKWHPPGHDPTLVLNAPYDTELEVLEAMASGYADAVDHNGRGLTRLERWLRGAWVCFLAAPITAAILYYLR